MMHGLGACFLFLLFFNVCLGLLPLSPVSPRPVTHLPCSIILVNKYVFSIYAFNYATLCTLLHFIFTA
jgi:hypothetical protein